MGVPDMSTELANVERMIQSLLPTTIYQAGAMTVKQVRSRKEPIFLSGKPRKKENTHTPQLSRVTEKGCKETDKFL